MKESKGSFDSVSSSEDKKDFVSFYKSVVIVTSMKEFVYQFKINEEMPRFSFQPVSREICHRLCLRIVTAKSIDEFITPTERAGDEKRLRDE